MSVFLRTAKTTISKYLKEEEINILSNQRITALLTQKKRVSYNHSGKSLVWPVKKSRNGITPYTDGSTLSFTRHNRHEQAELEWRAYVVPEAVTWLEKLMNKGKEAQVNYTANLGESIKEDLESNFAPELYKDGYDAANAGRIHGFKSCLGVTSNAQYTLPYDTYAGLSTTLGGLGGTLTSGSWPTGVFDAEYHSWSPLVVNYTHSGWAAGTDTWANNAQECMRMGILHQQNARGKKGMLDLIVTNATMYGAFLDAIDEKERINVMREGQKSGLVSLGFTNVVNYDGVDVTYEYDCPATEAYGLNFGSMELCSLQGQLFDLQDDSDLDTLSDRIVGCFAGNLKLNPRHMVFFNDIT